VSQSLFVLRAHVQVIVQDNGLPVQHKGLEVGVGFEDIEQFIDEMDEFQPKLLEGQVPLAIPVGV